MCFSENFVRKKGIFAQNVDGVVVIYTRVYTNSKFNDGRSREEYEGF